MRNELSIHHLTLADVSVEDFIRIASREGCSAVTLFTNDLGFNLPKVTAATVDQIRRVLDGEGVGVTATSDYVILDGFVAGFPSGIEPHQPYLEIAARLGARHVIAAVGDENEDQAIDIIGRFGEAVGQFGMDVAIEFLLMTPGCSTIQKCDRLLRKAGVRNAGILLDVTHFTRSGGSVAQLRNMDTSLVTYIHLADGLAEIAPEKIEDEVFHNRLVPGQGEFPLVEILRTLPSNVIYEIEAPNHTLRASGLSAQERASRNILASIDIIQQAG